MRIANWILMNGGFLVLFYLGFHMGIEGARTCALFMAWAHIVVMFLIGKDAAIEVIKKHGRSVPGWISGAFDILATGLLLWYGMVITGVLYAISAARQYALYEEILSDTVTTPQEERAGVKL